MPRCRGRDDDVAVRPLSGSAGPVIHLSGPETRRRLPLPSLRVTRAQRDSKPVLASFSPSLCVCAQALRWTRP